MVVAVSAPVLKEPVVPDPPVPEEEVHEVLLVDDHEMVVLAPFAIEDDVVDTDTAGALAEPTVIVMF
ncbi:MAG: hypothetical protein NUV63_04660 [Gallionella sp.]|nr:hypothetical protein [Gallionella sp.]